MANQMMNVFVHGLYGWGEANPVYRVFPQWGMASGSILKDLRRHGYRCCAPDVGPISSAWDRACELYAQLTGTRVDYGAAHAAAHGHARFGRSHTTPLAPNWSAANPINLIGHSFGGATSRMLLELLANGSAAECAACGDPSPLFQGGKADWVHSVTCIASPHNGSTLGMADLEIQRTMASLNEGLAKTMIAMSREHLYDFRLEHFGVGYQPEEDFTQNVLRVAAVTIANRDGAFFDLSVDGALALNARIATQPNVYYFSEPACRTEQRGEHHKPERGAPKMLRKTAAVMGAFCGTETPNGVEIDRSWLPNDGMVNTISALCPQGAPHREITEDTRDFAPGVWNVLPVRDLDHLEMVGGVGHPVSTRRRYRALMARIDATL